MEHQSPVAMTGHASGDTAARAARGALHGRVEVREVAAGEVSVAVRLLREFAPHVAAADWESVLLGPGATSPHTIGYGLYAEEELVGFLGAIPSVRQIGGRSERICNLHSVFVRPRYTAAGSYLLLAAMADSDVTLTALTPSPRVGAVLKAAKFRELETSCLLHFPLPIAGLSRYDRARLLPVTGAESSLDPAQARLLRDHAPLGCRGYVFLAAGASTLIVTRPSRLRRLPMLGASDILHIGDPDLAGRYFSWLKLAIMRAERSVVLRCDARLLGRRPALALARARPGYFRSARLGAADIDNLYSEMLYQRVLSDWA